MPDDSLDVTATVSEANDELEDFLRVVDESLGDSAPGMGKPSVQEQVAAMFQLQAQYPPALYEYPDGRQVFASPWFLAQEFSENGNEWVGPFNQFVAKQGGI